LRAYDLRDDPKGRYSCYRIRNSIGDPYNIERVNCALNEVWEMRPGAFLLVCTTDKTELNATNLNGNVNNNFVWEIVGPVLREARFDFDPVFNDFQIDVGSTGAYSMFRTFFFNGEGAV
jgi:hypothetical protein